MRAYRSSLRLFVFGIVGILLIAAATDVMFGHWVSTPPDSIDGALTTRGYAQQRGDLLVGGAMFVIGVLLFGGAITELIRRKPAVSVNAEGLVVDSGGGGHFIPWGDIGEISSGVIPDPYDGAMREQLIVELTPDAPQGEDQGNLPHVGSSIYIDAHDWANRVTEVALAAQGANDHYDRMEALRTYEAPSIVWETTGDESGAEPIATIEQSEPEPEEDGE